MLGLHKAMGERHGGIYPEVLGAQHFLKYESINTGCCSILHHPVFGTKVCVRACVRPCVFSSCSQTHTHNTQQTTHNTLSLFLVLIMRRFIQHPCLPQHRCQLRSKHCSQPIHSWTQAKQCSNTRAKQTTMCNTGTRQRIHRKRRRHKQTNTPTQ